MKNLKKILILLFIIIVIMILIMVILSNKENKENREYLSTQGDNEITGKRNVFEVKSKTTYFSVERCIKKYYENLDNNLNKALYNILDKNYIKSKNINEENILNILEYKKDMKYSISEMYYIEANSQIPYYVKGKLFNNNSTEDIFFNVILDLKNETFSVNLCGEEEYKNSINGFNDYVENPIDKNEYNNLNFIMLSDEEIVKKYFYDYIENVVYYPTFAYRTLNETYSKKRFENYNEYKDYLKLNIENYRLMENNKIKIQNDFKSEEEYNQYLQDKFYSGMKKYKINQFEEYSQFICIDFNDNYYIFNVFPDFKYDVILDTYTIDLPQFIEKYNSANIHERVAMNIEKFIKSLNSKDYRYAYNCLAEGFKNNKFKNFDIFKNYITKNIFENNIVEYESFKNEGETYIYNINLKNANNESEFKQMQVIMKLEEGTNFIMSFNFRE